MSNPEHWKTLVWCCGDFLDPTPSIDSNAAAGIMEHYGTNLAGFIIDNHGNLVSLTSYPQIPACQLLAAAGRIVEKFGENMLSR